VPLELIALLLLPLPGLQDAVVVARYRDGVVLQEDADSFARALGREGKGSLQDRVEAVVLMRTLARRFDERADAADRRRLEIRAHHEELARVESLLQGTLRLESAASPEEVRRAFDADPASFGQPRLWRLENLFKRFPRDASAEDKERIRQRMEALRARIAGGEDLSALAASESESETRLRGGRMGMASLDQLKPPLASVVSGMKAGDLSPVVETADGVTLLRCTDVREARPPDFEEARGRIAKKLGQEHFAAAWARLETTLLEGMAPLYRPEAMREAALPATPVASYVDSGARRDRPWDDAAAHLLGQGIDRASALTPEQLTASLRQRLLLEGYRIEAARRGLLEGAAWKELAAWKAIEAKASAEQSAEAERRMAEPGDDEVRKGLGASAAELVTPARLHLLSLKLPIDRALPRRVYDEAREAGEALAAGSLTWPKARAVLGPAAEERDHGWLTEADVFKLGVNADEALRSTKAGESTRLVQEGRALFLFHVLAREDPRPLSPEEARAQVRATLRAARKATAVRELRSALLQEQAIRLGP
jgi:PPIC-type PPIASE domain